MGGLRDNSIGTMAAVGNALDLPGSMVRDVLAWKNPLDQVLSPFSSKNRTTGRQLLRKHGLAGRRNTWGNAIAGFGAEVALDPLTYLSFGGSALGKSGHAAKNAGLFDDLSRVASAKTGKAMGGVGPRQSRLNTTLNDFVQFGRGDTVSRARKLIDEGHAGDEVLGGLAGLNMPFGKSFRAVGTGSRSNRIAGAMDKVGETVRYGKVPFTDFAPVDALAGLFDNRIGAAKTRFGQEFNKALFRQKEKASVSPRLTTARLANNLSEAGASDEIYGDALRGIVEGVNDVSQLPEAVREAIGETAGVMRSENAAMVRDGRSIGMPVSELQDDEIDYAARFSSETSERKGARGGGQGKRGRGRTVTFDPSNQSRGDDLRNIRGGTNEIKRIVKDPALKELLEQPGTRLDDVENYLRASHESWLSDTYKVFDQAKDNWVEKPGRYKALADRISKMSPETRDAGIFGNHPLVDHEARRLAYEDSKTTVNLLAESLSQPGILGEGVGTIAQSVDRIPVGEFIQKVGLKAGDENEGFAKFLKDKLGYEGSIADLKKQTIRKDYAEDLAKTTEVLRSPEELGKIVDVIDNITNFSKGMWTSVFPAFHVRNLLSGQTHNAMLGMFDPQSLLDADAFMRGKVIPKASEIPAVQAEFKRRELPSTSLTDEEATKILGEMAYANGVLGKFDAKALEVTGDAAARRSGSLEDFLDNIKRPGENSFSPVRVARKAIAIEPGTSRNPFDFRGVDGRLESGFGPAAAGEELGHYGEGINRIAPWLNQIRKGVDPSEASKRVGAAQVLYSNRNFTQFEQKYLKRIFPFYSFSSRVMPQIVRELMEKPGGRLGQTVRAQSQLQDKGELAPEYVRETASIPLGDSLGKLPDGTDRYLTGLGMMHEDPFSFGPSVQQTGMELLGRTNPFIKAPLEWATGESFFQKGPDGGRDLDKLDPLVGRIVSNVTGQKENSEVLPRWLEQVVANSPAARGLSTVRQLTDPRKRYGDTLLPGPASLLNTMTGLRITDVSPGSKDGILRELLQEQMKEGGAKAFERVFFSNEDKAKMTPEQLKNAEDLQALANLLARRAKERASQLDQ